MNTIVILIITIISDLEVANQQLRSDNSTLETSVSDLMKTKREMEKIVFDQLDLIKDLSGKVEDTTGTIIIIIICPICDYYHIH